MIIDAAELQRRYLQRTAGVRDNKVYIGPEVVDLQIIHSCNLTCLHCWIHSPGNPDHFTKPTLFPWERFVGIVSDAVDLKVDQIHIGGKGEPTMHPLFRDMVRYLEQQPLSVRLYTNATFPADYCSDVMKVDHLVINFGAVDRQQYLAFHGKDFFDRVVANIERLVSLRDAVKPELKIDIAYILNTVNVNQKQKMQELASRLGVNSVNFKKMSLHQYNQVVALPESSMGMGKGEVPPGYPSVPGCLNGWFYLLVKLDGNTSTCCHIQEMRIGDLDNCSFKELWFSPRMKYMLLIGKNGHIQKVNKACQTCQH